MTKKKNESDLFDSVTLNVQRVLMRYRDQNRLSEIANKMGIHAPRLSELLTGKRKLSYYYLEMFFSKGVMSMDEVLRDVDTSKMPKKDQIIIHKLKMSDDIVEAVVKAQAKGINIAKVLRAMSE
jgi:hypothetical protein